MLSRKHGWDEKERVAWGNVSSSSYRWRIKIIGTDVDGDDAPCGTSATAVHFAFFFEDSNRNDANGPGSETDVECL